MRTVYKGIAANKGAAYGRLIVKASSIEKNYDTGTSMSGSMIRKERSRYFRAVEEANKTLDLLMKRADSKGKEILEAEKFLLNDPAPNKRIVTLIKEEKLVAEEAVRRAAAYYIELFGKSEDESIRARSEAIAVIRDLALDNLDNKRDEFVIPNEPVILVASSLTAADMIAINRNFVKGIVLTKGSVLSHAAILAKSYNIPMLVKCELRDFLKDYDSQGNIYAVLDSREDSLIVNPSDDDLQSLEEYKKDNHSNLELVKYFLGKESKTKVYANVADLSEVDKVLANDVEGIGLFRSELLFLSVEKEPSEEEQFNVYKKVLVNFADKARKSARPVTIRTADFGGDKTPKYIHLENNERGIAFSLREGKLFERQLRALLKASYYGNLSIMVPMIRSTDEFKNVKTIINRIKADFNSSHIPYDRNIKIGAMIETPEAVEASNELAELADFFSIGTNDLISYTLAKNAGNGLGSAIRENFPGENLESEEKELIRTSIAKTVMAAKESGITVSICGELASNHEWIPFFNEIGVDVLSIEL